MKYLKRIFESVDKDDLLEFCESNLIYLIDEGFKIEVYRGRATNDEDYSLCIKITKVDNTSSDAYLFSWNDIKDYFITFIQRLINNYELHKGVYWWNPTSNNYGRPCKPVAGIMFDYVRPSFASPPPSFPEIGRNMFDNQWFKYPFLQANAMIIPTTEQILNDEIYDDPKTKHYGWNCMDFIYEINILVKE